MNNTQDRNSLDIFQNNPRSHHRLHRNQKNRRYIGELSLRLAQLKLRQPLVHVDNIGQISNNKTKDEAWYYFAFLVLIKL